MKVNRTLSGCLAILMLISILPFQAFAMTGGQSVILPISEEDPVNRISMMSFSNEIPIYFSKASISLTLPDIDIPRYILDTAEGARIQAVDQDNNVVAQTGGFDIYYDSIVREKTIFALKIIPEGEFPLQLIYGDVQEPVIIPLNYVLTVVDAPVITYGYVTDLTEGIVPFQVNLEIAGFDGDAERFSFDLVDEKGVETFCESRHIRTESMHNYGASRVTYSLFPSSGVIAGTTYSLKITVGSGDLYSSARRISTEANYISDEIAILEVIPSDTVMGQLDIKVGGINEDSDYKISVTQGFYNNNTNYVYKDTIQPIMQGGNGIFKITLSKNGLILPLSAYGRMSFYIMITDNKGNQDSIYYYNENSYENQSVELSLKKTDDNVYMFTLTGCNMLLDLYENNDLSFKLKESVKGNEIVVGDTSGTIEKSYYTSNGSIYFVFKGSVHTNEALKNGSIYRLYHMDESLATISTVDGGETENLDIYNMYIVNYNYVSNSFNFNFGQLPLEVTLLGSNETAIAQLYDITDGKIVSQTENVTGILDANGNYKFLFTINEPEISLVENHEYTFYFISNGQTVKFKSYNLYYDSEVEIPQYYTVLQPVIIGDTSITLQFYYNLKNVTLDYYINNKVNIINQASETPLDYTEVEAIYKNHMWYLTLKLSKPVDFGSYKYGQDLKFDVVATEAPILGNVRTNSEIKTIFIEDCYKLKDTIYTSILYDTKENGYGKLYDLTLERINNNTLKVTEDLVSKLANGSYTMAVYADNTYIGTVEIYISWNDEISSRVIKGYNTNGREILYQTDSDRIYLYTNNPGYSYVRYSENNDFSDTSYTPVREYRRQSLMLSENDGVKIIYVQFKNSEGKESPVYTWVCEKVKHVAAPSIVRAWISVDGFETIYIPIYTDFSINLISDSRLSNAYVKFTEINGNTYYDSYHLAYKDEVDGGFLFQVVLNSGDYPFYNTYFNFSTVDLYLTDITDDINYEKISLPISLKPLEHILLADWGIYDDTVYSSQSSYQISGYATPNSSVTVTCGSMVYGVQANSSGMFSVKVTGLVEGIYRITAQDSEGLSTDELYYYHLIVDTTAPVLDSLKATMVDGNVVISWSSNYTDVEYYLIWRDGGIIKGPNDKYTSTSYIFAGAAGSVFKVVAVDKAGNLSEEKTVMAGDMEAPTAPGQPVLTAHGTKSISFMWEPSSDNVAVYQYEIYRDDILLETVDYRTTSYSDNGLYEGTEYKYKIYAFDRAGNKSEASEALLSTAILTIYNSTNFLSEYIKEESPNGIDVIVELDASDSYYDVSQSTVKLQYKTHTDLDWSELLLTGTAEIKSGKWEIEDLDTGTYKLRFIIMDSEGTEKVTMESTTIISQDMIPPIVVITSPSPGSIKGGKDLVITGEAIDNVEINRVELSYSLDGGITYNEIVSLKNEEILGRNNFLWSHTFDASTLPSGGIVFKAEALDGRDNQANTTVTFNLDNTPPETPNNFRITSTSEYIGILWNYPNQDGTSDFSNFRVCRSTSANGQFENIGGDHGVNFYDTAQNGIKADILYYYYVTAVDIYGNESEPTTVLSGMMTMDNTPPTIVSYLPLNNSELCKETNISVSLYDNSLLNKLDIFYRKMGEEDWQPLTSIKINKGSVVLNYDWDVSTLEPGDYQVKLTAIDASNLGTDRIVKYTIKSYSLPVAPVNVTATGIDHRAIRLNWSYSGDKTLLVGFQIMRKDSPDGEYILLKTISNPDLNSFVDENLILEKEYIYKIVALDKWIKSAESTAVSVMAPSNDTELPVAKIAAANLTIAKDRIVTLTGSGSTDNDKITSYSWDFGDGTTESGETVTHVYSKEGKYDITLTVTDLAGNKGKDIVSAQVIDMAVAENMMEITLEVVDSITTSPLSSAEIKVINKSLSDDISNDITLVTDSNGKAMVVLRDGDYTVHTIYNGYLLRTNSLKVGEDTSSDMRIGMSRSNMLLGSMTATAMTYDEILRAGIDVEDPKNQHVYRFAAVLEFTPERDRTYEIPINYFVNNYGKILGYEDGDGCFPWYFGNWQGTIYPISQNVYLIIYGEAKWLKEMFHVQLLLTNTSATDYIEECIAELTLPEGLSLANMIGPESRNLAIQTVGTIAEQSKAEVNWYVRGDAEGEYDLTANVRGIYMPNPEEFSINYTTARPIRVWAGGALHLFIEAERSATAGQDYRVEFRLENVSDKELYNLSLNIFGGKFFDEYDVSDLEYKGNGGDLSGTWNKGNGKIETKVLAPGESIGGIFKIVFEGDMIEEGLRYMLSDMFVHTMEGSTTEIGTSLSFINHKDTAIVVIPGIMGSELLSGDTKVWPPGTIDYITPFLVNQDYEALVKQVIFDLLAVQVTGDAGEVELKGFFQRKLEGLVYALKALRAQKDNMGNINVYAPSSDQYGSAGNAYQMVESMKTYTENTYLFSYDWRDDNRKAAAKLKEFIDSLEQEKIIIVAHSMGGLVTSAYETLVGNESPVDKIITMGTPYLGTPQAVLAMLDFEEFDSVSVAGWVTAFATILSGADINFSLDADDILKEFRDKIFEDYIAPINVTERYFEILELIKEMDINKLYHYYQGLYQLVPSEAYGNGRFMFYKDGTPLEDWAAQSISTTHDLSYYWDHKLEFDNAKEFHRELNESETQVLAASDKTYFVVGYGNKTAGKLIIDKNKFEIVDIGIVDGDGTVTLTSATMNGSLPVDRSYYYNSKHLILFSDPNAINLVKNILYDDEILRTEPFIKPYKKIIAECPVDVFIKKDEEVLSSQIFIYDDITSFGRVYVLGEGFERKIFFVDDDKYEIEILGYDIGKMDFTVEYYDGVNNDEPLAEYVFRNIPITDKTKITFIDAAFNELDNNNVMKLLIDNDGDGAIDKIALPDKGSGDSGNEEDNDDDNKDDIENGHTEKTPNSSDLSKPVIKTGEGGSVTINTDGTLNIVLEDGYVVYKIIVNGKVVDLNNLPKIKPSDKVEILFEKKPIMWVNPYNDVKETDWFYEVVRYVSENRLMVGVGNSMFAPNDILNRAMLVTVLWNMEEKPEPVGENPFTDLMQDWYIKAVVWASENGIVAGYGDGRFGPDDNLTREQMAVILYRYSQYKGYNASAQANLSSYTDSDEISIWAIEAMKWANASGLITGRSETGLVPQGIATRAEMASVLKRYLSR